MPKAQSAGIIAYFKENETTRVLVCKPGGPYFTNTKIYGFPKGRSEQGETLKQTALREFLEETGIDLIDYRTLNDSMTIITGNKNYTYFFYETPEIWDLSTLKSNLFYDDKTKEWHPENDDFQYMTLDELETQTFDYLKSHISEIKKKIK